MSYPKFIIEGDSLIMGMVEYHKSLVTDRSKVKGGGWFRFKKETNTFEFQGSSHDFGEARIEDIQKCIESDQVFSSPAKIQSIAKDHNFVYNLYGEIIELSFK